ncbi:MAG: SPFH domain / Band 7 family protein [Bacteroidetes bacterium ADurb.Bin416]|jgi:regulator of protease activity HflC (stomatin/prohibitin superfamily)|nr:MAG: SPFH domain / Band 7 family protein [Bacteroidetes bacterium ADurb.Bin416]
MKTNEAVFKGTKLPGIPMLLFNLLLPAGLIWLFITQINAIEPSTGKTLLILGTLLLFLFSLLAWFGFVQVEPNEARVMVFFGRYHGTLKENGFFWVNPFYAKKKLTLRARNLDATPIKVNDKAGNPVMIGQVLVWRINDTYKASFDIDNASENVTVKAQTGVVVDQLAMKMKAYENFVKVQSDAALRQVAGQYPYDEADAAGKDVLTLRGGGEEINLLLEKQLSDRLAIAGIEVVEARINYLAYAPEIAAVMLRRQQADAIIAAREKIVEGAVGMVKLALDKLKDEGIIELDDDKRAAMVSNLLVVLCGEESTQPIVNAGTLYN